MRFFIHIFKASIFAACFLFCESKLNAQCGTPIAVTNSSPYVANFETGQEGWTAGGTLSDWACGVPNKAFITTAGSGANCWVTGGLTGSFYNYSERSWVQSPCFDFTNLQHPFIAFLMYRESEYKYDGTNLQYSLDGGTTWNIIGSVNDVTDCMDANWYNYANIKYLTSVIALDSNGWCGNHFIDTTIVQSGTTCALGNGLTWTQAKHCLQNLAGQPSVIIRFTFGAGTTCNDFDGIAFDSVAISEAVANSGTLTYSCTASNTVAFTGTAALPCTDNFAWNFGDPNSGASNTSASANPTHTFSAAGSYVVSLIISGGPCNAPDTILQTINILSVTSTVTNISCNGGNNGSIDLTTTPATGSYTYSWTGGSTSQNQTGLTAGTYNVTVTGAESCSATASATVSQPAVLAVTAAPSGGGCTGGNTGAVNTTVTGGTSAYSYSWGGGITTPNRTGLGSGTYTVTVTDSKGCTATASASITINSNPAVTVNSASVCSGGTATLTATASPAGGTYSWSTGATTSSISVSPTTNTGYTVTYSTISCGSATAAGNVAVASSATVTVNDTIICTGGTATLTATPNVANGTYLWSPGNSTNQSITVPSANAGSFTVTYTPVGCPAATGSGTVTVAPLPTVTLAATNPGCNNGGMIVATGAGGLAPYEYSLNGGAYQDANTFTNLAAGTDTVVTIDTLGCVSAPATATIVAYVPLALSSTIDSITCTSPTGQINASATGGTSPYQFSEDGGAYQNSGTFSGLSAASYTVTVKDAAGCTATETVVIPPPSNIAASATPVSALCFGQANGGAVVTVTGGSSPFQYALNGGAYQSSNTFSNLAAGSYNIMVKDANGCQAATTVTVSQPSAISVSVSATGITCPGAQDGSITATGTGGTLPYTYVMTRDSLNFITSATGTFGGLDSGTYSVELTDAGGCPAVGFAHVPGATKDTFAVIADSTSCAGIDANDGAVVVTPLLQQNAPFQYSLNGGTYQSSDSFQGLSPGLYQVVAEDVNGCTTTLPSVTVAEPAPAFAAAYPTDTSIRLGDSVQLGSYLYGGSVTQINSYMWSPSYGLSCIDCQNPVDFPYTDATTYTVTITYNGHCTANAMVTVLTGSGVVYIPNVFTPNGDGNNDVLYVYGYGIKIMILKVFNRWGEKVFESHEQSIGWDGTYKGRLQDPAVFVYECNIVFLDNTSRLLKGSVTLLR